jgi:peptide/nickel transport system permease protein
MNTAVSTAIPKPLASGVASTAAPRLAPSPAPAAKSLRPVLIDLQRLRRLSPTLALAWLVIATAALWALVPGWFAHQNPVVGQAGQQLLEPGLAHWLGTDALGRDLWARVVHGSVHSLSGAFLAVAVGLVAGTLIGLLAGAAGGRVDDALMRLVDVLLAVPSLLLSLTIIILLGFGTINAAIAVGVASVAGFARLVRSEVVRVRRSTMWRRPSAAADALPPCCGAMCCPIR